MSDTPDATVVAEAPPTTAVAEKPAEPVEKPFNLDLLQSCTARMTHQCWRTYLALKDDLAAMQSVLIRATLNARTEKGLQEIVAMLQDVGVTARTQSDKCTLDFTATFAQIQTVIKHPQTHTLDAVRV
jgi:hypothetical protein